MIRDKEQNLKLPVITPDNVINQIKLLIEEHGKLQSTLMLLLAIALLAGCGTSVIAGNGIRGAAQAAVDQTVCVLEKETGGEVSSSDHTVTLGDILNSGIIPVPIPVKFPACIPVEGKTTQQPDMSFLLEETLFLMEVNTCETNGVVEGIYAGDRVFVVAEGYEPSNCSRTISSDGGEFTTTIEGVTPKGTAILYYVLVKTEDGYFFRGPFSLLPGADRSYPFSKTDVFIPEEEYSNKSELEIVLMLSAQASLAYDVLPEILRTSPATAIPNEQLDHSLTPAIDLDSAGTSDASVLTTQSLLPTPTPVPDEVQLPTPTQTPQMP